MTSVRVKTAIIYGIVIFALLGLGYFFPPAAALLLVLIAIFSAVEMSRAFKQREIKLNSKLLALSYLSFIPSYIYLFSRHKPLRFSKSFLLPKQSQNITLYQDLFLNVILIYAITLIIILAIALFKPLLTKGIKSLKQISVQILASLYIAVPLFAGFLLLYMIPAGWFWFVLAIITPWFADSCAYFMGKKWGKKPIVPNLSPNKTYVGFWGSVIGNIIFYLPIFYLSAKYLYQLEIKPIYWLYTVLFAGILGAFIELGDWLASAIKRYCRIKDFSNLLPGHGGIIDRFDSTFFSFTAILTIALLIYFL